MSEIALRMESVYKKFRRGELCNSLRDLLPALTGRMFRQKDLSPHDQSEFWALQDLSFEVKRGEAFGLIGHNGAGKSTALKILSKIMRPTKGRMIVNGRLSALIEVSGGFHQDLTGRENIFLQGSILGMRRHEIQAKLDQIIAFSGIEEFIDTPVKRYSSGMYARLGFSVASHVEPDILIVDEVLSVGDYLFQAKCLERMKEVIRGGTAVLFVSHNLKHITDFCDRCLLLEKGCTVTTGPVQEVVSRYLKQSHSSRGEDAGSKPLVISKVIVRDESGECLRFQSGQKVWIDVEITARSAHRKLAVALDIKDEQSYLIFDTSTERLGYGNFALEEDEIFKCTFELQLNLANGTFYPTVLIYRHDTQTVFDRIEPAATIYVSSEQDVRGVTHCFPKVTRHEVCEPSNIVLS